MISEKAKGACRVFPVHSNQRRHCRHRISVGSLVGYIGEAMDEPSFSLALIMVKESFDIPAIFF